MELSLTTSAGSVNQEESPNVDCPTPPAALAITRYLRTIHSMTNDLFQNFERLSHLDKARIQYNLNTTINEAQFLVSVMSMESSGTNMTTPSNPNTPAVLHSSRSRSSTSPTLALTPVHHEGSVKKREPEFIQESTIVEDNNPTDTESEKTLVSEVNDKGLSRETKSKDDNATSRIRSLLIRKSDIIEDDTLAEIQSEKTGVPKVTDKTLSMSSKPSVFSNYSSHLVQDEDDTGREVRSVIRLEKPNVSWNSVIGLDREKEILKKAILFPLLSTDSNLTKAASRGVLLFGPRGVGKTKLVQAIASMDEDITIINIMIDSIWSKLFVETERKVEALFTIAREKSPSIIFIEDIDAIYQSRESNNSQGRGGLKKALLKAIDQINSSPEGKLARVVVICKTHLPQDLDDPFLQRFKTRIHIPLPNHADRKLILEYEIGSLNQKLNSNDIKEICSKTIRFSGADLFKLVIEAGMKPIREKIDSECVRLNTSPWGLVEMDISSTRPLNLEDFTEGLRCTRPTNDEQALRDLFTWNEKFGDGQIYHLEKPQHNKKKKTLLGKASNLSFGFAEFFFS